MCTVEVPTCRPICIAEVLRKAMRVRNLLNRRNPHIPGEPAAGYARRALFNDTPVDHELTAQILARETERIRQEMTAKWNFDFDTETPLAGRYQWTPVNETTREVVVTETYTTTTQPSTSSTTDDSLPELIPAVEPTSTSSKPPETRRVTRQRRVTEFMSQRKRSSSVSKSETSPEKKIRRMSSSLSTTP